MKSMAAFIYEKGDAAYYIIIEAYHCYLINGESNAILVSQFKSKDGRSYLLS